MSFQNNNIAIIGFGAGGILTFYHLVNNFKNNDEKLIINIFDGSEVAKRGIAYSTNNLNHLLNVPTIKMGALHDDPKDFANWLKSQNIEYPENGFMPRKIYGQYLQNFIDKACKIADQKKIQYNFIAKNIDKISEKTGKIIIEDIAYDHCILAIGMELKNNPLNFWYDQIEDYLDDQEIHIIGAGLTAFDAIVALQSMNYRGKIIVHSRTGIISMAHMENVGTAENPLVLEDADLPLSIIFQRFIKASRKADNWRSVIDAFRPLTQKFWQRLSIAKKQQFMRHCFRLWNSHRHRCPPVQDQKLQQLINSGKLVFTTERVDYSKRVLNCSGFNLKSAAPLVKNMIAENLAKPDDLDAGIIALDPKIHIIGGLNFGRLFETTAMPEIRVQSYEVAAEILGL